MTQPFDTPERDLDRDPLVETPESLRDVDREAMPLDRGREPGEGPAGAEKFGTTHAEEVEGEDLDHRLAQEEPDVVATDVGADAGDQSAEEAAMHVQPE